MGLQGDDGCLEERTRSDAGDDLVHCDLAPVGVRVEVDEQTVA